MLMLMLMLMLLLLLLSLLRRLYPHLSPAPPRSHAPTAA
jgi:hypothetical protein